MRPDPFSYFSFFDDSDDAGDGDWGDERSTIECPYCGRSIHEDTPRCPHCEKYLSDEDAPPARKPWWIIIGALACFYIVYRLIVG